MKKYRGERTLSFVTRRLHISLRTDMLAPRSSSRLLPDGRQANLAFSLRKRIAIQPLFFNRLIYYIIFNPENFFNKNRLFLAWI